MSAAALKLPLLLGGLFLDVVVAQIRISQPPGLVQQLGNHGHIRGVTTTLAAPTYEQTVVGLLYYTHDDKTHHCSPDSYTLDFSKGTDDQNSSAMTTASPSSDSTDSSDKLLPALAKIVLVRQAPLKCSLRKQVLVAQSKGADAVLVIDHRKGISEHQFLKTVVRSKSSEEGRGEPVTIPSILVNESVGNQLATAALKQHQGKENLIAVTLRWDIPDRDTVSMVLGMNSGALNVQRFLQNFAPKRVKLNDLLTFTPAYDIMSKDEFLTQWREELPAQEKQKRLKANCIGPSNDHDMFKLNYPKNATFCAKDPDGDDLPITGRDVVMQDLLHYCVWSEHHQLGQMSEVYWTFVRQLPVECPLGSGYSLDCAHKLLDNIPGMNKDAVRQCEEGGGDVLLDQQQGKDWAAPFFQINGWRYSGPPDAEQVFRAICHGYPVDRLPDPCVNVIRPNPDQPGSGIRPEDLEEALKKVVGSDFQDLVKQLEKALEEMRKTTTTTAGSPATAPLTSAATTATTAAPATTSVAGVVTTPSSAMGAVTRDEFKMMWVSLIIVIGGLFCALLLVMAGCGMCLQARMMQKAAIREVSRRPLLSDA